MSDLDLDHLGRELASETVVADVAVADHRVEGVRATGSTTQCWRLLPHVSATPRTPSNLLCDCTVTSASCGLDILTARNGRHAGQARSLQLLPPEAPSCP